MKALWVRSLWLILAGALFFGVIGVIASWAPDQPVEQLKSRWAKPPSRFIEVNGLQVHLRDEGPHDDPAPIVLLHGTSASLHTWQGWAVALRDQRRVIRFDLPGFGLTGPSHENDYSTRSRRALRAGCHGPSWGCSRFVLGGNSLGGLIAWSAAARMPERVDRLILVDAAGYPPEAMTTPQAVPAGLAHRTHAVAAPAGRLHAAARPDRKQPAPALRRPGQGHAGTGRPVFRHGPARRATATRWRGASTRPHPPT